MARPGGFEEGYRVIKVVEDKSITVFPTLVRIPYPYRLREIVNCRGGFVTRPAFRGKEIPENGYVLADLFLHTSQGGLQTRPYLDDNTNTR